MDPRRINALLARKNAGSLDLKMVPERHNAIKVLLFFDIGGSMDEHVRVCEELFSASRGEFKHMEYFYFHNCVYERVWKTNKRRQESSMSTHDVMRKYGPDYKVVFVGDASMSPYEISHAGGSVEHWNDESGAIWVDRLTHHFRRFAWLNPRPQKSWDHAMSINMVTRARSRLRCRRAARMGNGTRPGRPVCRQKPS